MEKETLSNVLKRHPSRDRFLKEAEGMYLFGFPVKDLEREDLLSVLGYVAGQMRKRNFIHAVELYNLRDY